MLKVRHLLIFYRRVDLVLLAIKNSFPIPAEEALKEAVSCDNLEMCMLLHKYSIIPDASCTSELEKLARGRVHRWLKDVGLCK